MKKITHLYVCTDELGEVDGMFDETGNLLGAWCLNDAVWRQEYFRTFMEALDVEIVKVNKATEDQIEQLMDWFGF